MKTRELPVSSAVGVAHASSLARVVLPALLERVRGHTEEFQNLGDLSDAGCRLHAIEAESRAMGWVLGVLGSASGADLLLVRRDPAGLATLVELLTAGLRTEGRELRAETPRLAPGVGRGWELPWCVGALLLHSARARELGEATTCSWIRPGELACPGPTVRAHQELGAWLERELPGCTLHVEPSGWRLELPRGWLLATSV